MQRLLVTVDGSESALRAVRHAIARAKSDAAVKVHLVTVHEEPILFGEVTTYISLDEIEALQRKQSERVLEPAARELDAAGVSYAKEILVGPIAQTIAKRADELGCDGIVMGTRGMTALGGLVLGSVATKVVHVAKMPVTLVK